jgi:hypothetical protein
VSGLRDGARYRSEVNRLDDPAAVRAVTHAFFAGATEDKAQSMGKVAA